jgi:hypothetical protein
MFIICAKGYWRYQRGQGGSANWFRISLDEVLAKIQLVVGIKQENEDSSNHQSKTYSFQKYFNATARRRMRNLKRALDKRKALLLPASVEGDSLYIMQNTRIPNEVKVGRSGVITKRKKRMEECQSFTITVHAF